MKNIIKRGTSLLLVLAMLLSFAAVVGAEEPTTTTPEKILTLTVENKLLRAGQTEYLAVYEEVAEGYKITGLTISATSTNSKVVVKGVYPWIPKSYLGKEKGWDYDYNAKETVFTSPSVGGEALAAPPTADPLLVWTSTRGFQTSDKPLCFIAVEAQEDVTPGAYQINICRNPHPEKPDDHFLFAYPDPVTDKDLSQTEENAILNPGTAVVIPANAPLPTVILTQSSFAAPTQAGLAVGGEAAGDYDLTKYVKLVTEEGLVDVTSLSVTVNGDKSVSLKQGNVLSLATTAEKDKGYKLTVTAANGKQLAAAVELPFTVSKQDSAFTMVGFTKNGGYSMDFAGPYEAPAYSGTTANKFVSLNPKAYDQYGMPMGQATTELKLYSDAACTKEITSGNAFESVTVAAETGSVQISKNLRADVWCKVRASATIDGVTKTSEWITFQIKSNYPQPRKAILSLTDGSGNPFSGDAAKGTFDIPGGSGETTIKFAVDHFIDQFGHTMDNNTEPKSYAVNFKVPTTTTVPGVECTSNGTSGTITVTSTAASNAPITGTFEVVSEGTSIDAYLTDTTTPATLTIKKADPIASSLASMENGVGDYKKGKIFPASGSAFPTVLPGIGGDEASVVLAPLYVLDQYDAVMQTVAAANYKLYKVDGETKTPISADYAKFEDGSEGRVTLKLTNALAGEEGAKSLALTAGNYQIEATYNNKTATASFAMVEGETKLSGTPIYYDVETGNEPTLYVPYTYGTLDSKKATTMQVGAAITTQYGRPYGGSETPAYALNNVKLNEETIENKAITWTAEADGTGVTFTVDKSAAQLFGTSNTATLTAEMTVTVGEKSTPSIPISITIKKEASVLSAVKVEMAEDTAFTTGLRTWSANRTSESKEGEVTLLSPNAKKTWYIRRTAEDQYGVEMDIQSLVTATGCSWSYDTDKATGKILYFKLGVPAGFEESFVMQFTNFTKEYKFTAKFVPMEFVKSETGKNDTFQLSDYLNRTANEDGTFSAEYNGQPWSTILAKKDGAKVYIKTAEGENNTEIPSDKLTLEVTKDGAPVGMDAKANAGSYQVKLVYTDAEGQKYTVDEKTFTITPKTVKITVTGGAITKEYDGTQSLVLPSGVTLTIEGNPADLTVDPNALQYASADASAAAINIVLAEGKTTCLTGDAAANYTADPSKLTGTITKRQLTVTPNEKTFTYGQDTEINAALASEYTTNINELPTTCVAPTIEGSMVLQKNGEAKTIYNADTYDVANGLRLTGASAGNYEIQFTPGVQWTINRKLLTKVIADKSSSSGFGATAEACITEALKAFVRDEYVSINDTAFVVSDFVNKDDLSFPSSTEYVTGQNGTKYPVPKTYTLTVKDKPKKDIGKNYRVDDTTEYEFNYTVNQLNASDLIVTLTKADGSTYSNENPYIYNGQNQTPTAKVTYEIKQSGTVVDTLDLTSRCKIEVPTQAIDAGSYSIKITSDLLYSTQSPVTVPWKIDPKRITDGMFTQKSDHPVYDGTEQTLTGGVLDGKDSGITVNGENKVLKLGTDFTAAEVKQTNAGEYTMTVTGQGNYTGTADVKVKIDKYEGRVYTEIDKLQNTTVEVTRGQSVEYEILTDVVLHEQELVATLENEKIGKIGYQIHGAGGNMAGIENPRIEVTGDKKLLFKATVTNQVEVGREFHITFENSLDNENIKSRLVLTISFVVTEKPEQKDFRIVEGSEGTYSYSQGGLQLTTTGSEKGSTVSWSSSNTEFATVDNNGKVTFVKPTTTAGVIITATASETSAPNALFKATERTYRLTITKGQVTITASSATMTANDPLPGFSATASGLNPNDSVSEVFQTLTASAGTDGKTAGTFRVTPNATFKTGGRKNWSECYDLYFVAGTLTVNPAQTAIDVVLPIIIGGNTCANGYANCACESFYDLDASRWYHEAIDWAYSLDLMNGTTKSTFGPNAAATRAQTWTMLARIAGQDTRRSSTWYEVGQKWAMNLGITDGTNPMGSLTREQLAAMLYRYVGSPAVNGALTFTDSANVSAWARNAMIWAVQNGILDGVGGNRLNPKGTTTRAQAAAIFMRFSKLINK